ncbi:hypothetical protein SSS_04017 [Sarcoptes scabiei]|uniref:Uncharacterized protein n=1 Tax=Sarcoptes scabiei TaxID=52283 RepID=A0A834VEY3_SARSC|nr:hypothetical protein SSS_04017 [Sarcoptes scabiei]
MAILPLLCRGVKCSERNLVTSSKSSINLFIILTFVTSGCLLFLLMQCVWIRKRNKQSRKPRLLNRASDSKLAYKTKIPSQIQTSRSRLNDGDRIRSISNEKKDQEIAIKVSSRIDQRVRSKSKLIKQNESRMELAKHSINLGGEKLLDSTSDENVMKTITTPTTATAKTTKTNSASDQPQSSTTMIPISLFGKQLRSSTPSLKQPQQQESKSKSLPKTNEKNIDDDSYRSSFSIRAGGLSYYYDLIKQYKNIRSVSQYHQIPKKSLQ